MVYGAEGIGLFRSEYLLGRSRRWPREDQQVDVYRRLLDQMRPHAVTVRTLGRGPRGAGARRPHEPQPRARRARAAPAAPRARARSASSCGRCCARPARAAADHVPLRVRLRRPARGARPAGRRPGRAGRGGAAFGRDHGGGHQPRGAERGGGGRPPGRARWTSSASAPTTSSSTCWRWTGSTRGWLASTSPCTPPCCARSRHIVARRPRPHAIPVSVCGEMAADPLHAAGARGPRRPRAVHEPGGDPAGEGRAARDIGGARRGGRPAGCSRFRTAAAIEAMLRRELAPALVPAPGR